MGRSERATSSDDVLTKSSREIRRKKSVKRAIQILWSAIGGPSDARSRDKSYSEYKEDDWDQMNEKVKNLIKENNHPRVFTELEELHTTDGHLEWKETARWIKFEENVETGANR